MTSKAFSDLDQLGFLVLQELVDLVDMLLRHRVEALLGASDLVLKAHKLHLELHLKIAEYSGYPELRDAVARIHSLIFYWLYDVSAQDRNRPTQQWHQPLLKVLSGSDPDAAERAMRSHIRYCMDAVLDTLEPQFREGHWRLRLKA